MSSIDIDTIPGIKNLDDLAAEKYSGGSYSIAISASNGGISASTDGDGDINITIVAPADGSEINFGDVNLTAGRDINFSVIEVAETAA